MMSKKHTQALVPTLRFPEFRDAGEWEEKRLGEVGQTISGLSGKSRHDFGTGESYVTYKQVFDNAQIDLSKCKQVQIADNENQNKLQYGDVLFTTSSETPNEVGYASVLLNRLSTPLYLNSFCFAFRTNKSNILKPEFSCYLFHSFTYRKLIGALAQGITRFNISKGAFLDLKLPIPTLPEQKKIADCLSSLDELIDAQSRKIDALREHKRGLMQQLFPAEGERVPKLRFPEFRDAGEWEEKRLGEVGQTISGLSGKSRHDFGTGESYVTYKQVFDNAQIDLSKCKQVQIADNENQNKLQYGDVLFTTSSETPNEVGYASVLLNRLSTPLYLNSFCFAFRTNKSNILKPEFSCYLFHSFTYRKLIGALAQGITRFNISKGAFLDLKLPIPTLPEQKKIADCLSSLDEVIDAQSRKIDALREHKRGLMQQLFPTEGERS